MSSENEILKKGVADLKFGIWLEHNFGFYTMGVLVNADWDSNVLYQYNAETQVFQSSYDEINMIHIHSYSIEKRPWGLYLNLYGEDEVRWATFQMTWLNEKAPEYFSFNGLN